MAWVLGYWDIGLAFFAWTIVRSESATCGEVRRLGQKHSLGIVFTATLLAASVWPVVLTLSWLGRRP